MSNDMTFPTDSLNPKWELHDAMFSIDNMYKKIHDLATERHMPNTLIALDIMEKFHDGTYRKGKDKVPYIIHPLMIACHAFALGIADDSLIPVCLLHDVLEDTPATAEDLEMPEDIVEAVKLVSFDASIAPTRAEAKAIYYEKISHNRVAAIVKLLDRCNNLSNMATCFSREKMADYIEETEKYIIPMLTLVKHDYGEYYNAAFLLKYQILSVTETIKRLI